MSMNAAATIAPPAEKFLVNQAVFETFEEAQAEAGRIYKKYGVIVAIESI